MIPSPKTDHPEGHSNTVKDPDDWTTGDEAMTGAQASYLKTLCEEAGEDFDDTLTKAEASKRIDALQAKTGRGVETAAPASGKSGHAPAKAARAPERTGHGR